MARPSANTGGEVRRNYKKEGGERMREREMKGGEEKVRDIKKKHEAKKKRWQAVSKGK